jgi:hypothetical protein
LLDRRRAACRNGGMTFGELRNAWLGSVRAALFRRPAEPARDDLAREQELIAQFGARLPAGCATARAIDRGASWEVIAQCAVEDGYAEFADKLSRLVEKRLRRDA